MSGARPSRVSYHPVEKSYARQAPVYDRLWRKYNERTMRATLEAVPQSSFRRILDVACGPGLFIEEALRRWPDAIAVGLDVTSEMLEQARQRVGDEPRALFVRSLAESLPFPDGSFDLLVCANSFHHFRAPETALAEFRRVLRPSGFLVLTDWCDDYLACKVCDWWLRLTDKSHFKTYDLQECAGLLRAAGFHSRRSRRFKISLLWGLMTFQAQTPPAAGAGKDEVAAAVGKFADTAK
jgi:ubiquinone/menaquinone biosynthesis C-methylase UbiE